MVIYNHNGQCEFEGEILHTKSAFDSLNKTLQSLTVQDKPAPEIVFESTDVYSRLVRTFFSTGKLRLLSYESTGSQFTNDKHA